MIQDRSIIPDCRSRTERTWIRDLVHSLSETSNCYMRECAGRKAGRMIFGDLSDLLSCYGRHLMNFSSTLTLISITVRASLLSGIIAYIT
jgi:hypothetical protein